MSYISWGSGSQTIFIQASLKVDICSCLPWIIYNKIGQQLFNILLFLYLNIYGKKNSNLFYFKLYVNNVLVFQVLMLHTQPW